MNKKCIIILLSMLIIIMLSIGIFGMLYNTCTQKNVPKPNDSQNESNNQKESKVIDDSGPLEIIDDNDTSLEATIVRACQNELSSPKCRKDNITSKDNITYEIEISKSDYSITYFSYNTQTQETSVYGQTRDDVKIPDDYYGAGL